MLDKLVLTNLDGQSGDSLPESTGYTGTFRVGFEGLWEAHLLTFDLY